jgi:Zn-dependent peptidase ImmA (M78 family)
MRINDVIGKSNHKKEIQNFLKFVAGELSLSKLPKIHLVQQYIKNDHSNSFASYHPGHKEVTLYVKNRHILDILRSLAHELVHYKQDLNNKLDNDSGKTGSSIENEANAVAGIILRKYGKKHPELF